MSWKGRVGEKEEKEGKENEGEWRTIGYGGEEEML